MLLQEFELDFALLKQKQALKKRVKAEKDQRIEKNEKQYPTERGLVGDAMHKRTWGKVLELS